MVTTVPCCRTLTFPAVNRRFLPQKCWTKRLQDNLSRQDAKAQSDTPCHFDRREKSFLARSHSLGMTGRGHVSWRLCPSILRRVVRFSNHVVARVVSFSIL